MSTLEIQGKVRNDPSFVGCHDLGDLTLRWFKLKDT